MRKGEENVTRLASNCGPWLADCESHGSPASFTSKPSSCLRICRISSGALLPFLGEGSPTKIDRNGYSYSILSTGGPRQGDLSPGRLSKEKLPIRADAKAEGSPTDS